MPNSKRDFWMTAFIAAMVSNNELNRMNSAEQVAARSAKMADSAVKELTERNEKNAFKES